MKTRSALIAAAAGLTLAAAANATVTFTFLDPGPAREVTYTAGTSNSSGTVTYASTPAVELVFDGTQNGLPRVTYQTTLTMNITVGTAVGFGGVFSAPISGTFTFTEIGSGQNVLLGTLTNGALLTFGTTGVMAGTSSNATLMLVEGGPLATLLSSNGLSLAPRFDASFSLSDITPLPLGLTANGYIPSFNASAAFVGNAEVIPSAGAAALAGVAAMFLLPGRKRRQA